MGPDSPLGDRVRARGRQWGDVESMLAHLETLRKNADESLRKYVEAREEAGDLTSEGFSDDGSVRVEVDDNGQVVTIEIPDGVLGRLSYVGQMVVQAIKQAQAAHALKMAEIAAKMSSTIDIMSMVKDSIPGDVQDSLERRRDDRRY
ncbi:YbaB/EbfC family nucleoid-associated protein [Phytomonospora sp. NPDC050363]|uniref:YbaB/EbfC family nucleoid-associated protein n=1 Tax=Phytomonospora sp. NPDC050363 TaxID=3155642 RepID=UPI0033E22B15